LPAVLRPSIGAGSEMDRVYVRRFSRFGGIVEIGLSILLW
jgi:hypothetical protein